MQTKNERVFDSFIKTVENMQQAAVRELQRSRPRATAAIWGNAFRSQIGILSEHPTITLGRSLVSQPHALPIHVDLQVYGIASQRFQYAMSDLVRSLITGSGNLATCRMRALEAWREMADVGIDLSAYRRLVGQDGDASLQEARKLHGELTYLLRHAFPLLGRDIVDAVCKDIEHHFQAHLQDR